MFHEGFPNFLKSDVTKVVGLLPHGTYSNVTIGISDDFIQSYQDNNVIRFPYRI